MVLYGFRYLLRLCFEISFGFLTGSTFVHWGKSRCTPPTTLVYSGELVALDLFVKRPGIVHDIMGKMRFTICSFVIVFKSLYAPFTISVELTAVQISTF